MLRMVTRKRKQSSIRKRADKKTKRSTDTWEEQGQESEWLKDTDNQVNMNTDEILSPVVPEHLITKSKKIRIVDKREEKDGLDRSNIINGVVEVTIPDDDTEHEKDSNINIIIKQEPDTEEIPLETVNKDENTEHGESESNNEKSNGNNMLDLDIVKQETGIRCETCSKVFKSKSMLKIHKRSHTGEKPFICDDCGRAFSAKSNMLQHQYTHKTDRPFSCPKCPSTFKTERLQRGHMEITHSESKPYSCDQCGTNFKVKRNLIVHMNIHTGIKPFHCEQCDYSSVRKSCLITHQWTHKSEKRFSCSKCKQCFTTKSKLVDHENNHNNIKPYKCKHCNKVFTRKDNLKSHIRSHTGTKPYKCSLCDKLFSSLQGLKLHKMTKAHLGDKTAVVNTWDEVPMKPNMVSVQLMTPYYCSRK